MTPYRQDPATTVAVAAGFVATLAGTLSQLVGATAAQVASLPFVTVVFLAALNTTMGSVRAAIRGRFSVRSMLSGSPARAVGYTCGMAAVTWAGMLAEHYGSPNPTAAVVAAIYIGAAVYELRSVAGHLAHVPWVGLIVRETAQRLATRLGNQGPVPPEVQERTRQRVEREDEKRRGRRPPGDTTAPYLNGTDH